MSALFPFLVYHTRLVGPPCPKYQGAQSYHTARIEEVFYYTTFRRKPALLATCFTLVPCLVYSSTPMIEATCSSETSDDFQRPAKRYIPEDTTVHNHRCENLKSYRRNGVQSFGHDWCNGADIIQRTLHKAIQMICCIVNVSDVNWLARWTELTQRSQSDCFYLEGLPRDVWRKENAIDMRG
jgi:hypothetical protein